MTLAQLLRTTATTYKDRVAYVVLGKDPLSWNYQELYDRVRRYATVLERKGLRRGDRVAIVGENGVEWAVFYWACQCLGYVVVPIYPTLPEDQTQYVVKDSGTLLVACGAPEQLKKVAGMEGVQALLLKGEGSIADEAADATIDLAAIDKSIDQVREEDPCTIIYTSGTTGTPKGAVMPNRAFVHVCKAARDHIQVDENDSFLSFLTMSHVYELVAGQCLPISLGASICFSKSLASLGSELAEFKPTILLCVPRFLENFRGRIVDAVSKAPPLRQKLFALMLSQGVKKARGEFAPLFPILDKLVGAKIRERTGGRIRYFVSGGAALPPVVAEFYIAMGLVVLQGYGLTETSGGTFVNKPENNKYWTVGESLQMESKIADDGEILLRGPALMLGYHNLPDETAAAIDPEGWFHTGDIGEFEGKNLKITDRKKDLLVLANGKNIAPQKVENLLSASDFIQESVVVGDGQEYCAALIIPNFDVVRRTLGLADDVVLSGNPEAKALIKKEVDKVNKGLASFELVKKHVLLDQPFSLESGELTPTLKVKRKVVQTKYADQIQSMF